MSVSSRVLRKFQGDNLGQKQEEEVSDAEDAPYVSGAARKLHVNRFDLLNQHSQSESEVKEDDDENEHDPTIENHNTNTTCLDARKKKKRKKKKSQRRNSEDGELGEDEVERSVREVNALLGDAGLGAASLGRASLDHGSRPLRRRPSKKGVLTIEHKHLNPKNELMRIFGSKIIQNDVNRKKGRGRSHSKALWLVTPREHWPPLGKASLSMKHVGDNSNSSHAQMFTFVHSPSYQLIQLKFFSAVETLDPDNIMIIANMSPYHVDTLLQLSDICKLSEDLAMAAELIERALYALESAFHPMFNIAKGGCRLDYRKQENRGFFISLFRHLTFVGQRACYRTALEFCKLILSLDPDEDPLAMVLLLDFYAIRAKEYAWLIQFLDEMEYRRNLSQLPNMAYSRAVAEWHLSGGGDLADTLLQDALLMFPGVLRPLLDKCGVQPDPYTNSHSYFTTGTSSQSAALSQLVLLYVHRSYHVWKEPALLAWLEKNTVIVLNRVNRGDPAVANYADKRIRRYEARPPRAVERHIFLSEIKEVMTFPVESINSVATFSFDPLSTPGLHQPVREVQQASRQPEIQQPLLPLLPVPHA